MSEYNIPTDDDIRSAYDAMCQLASAVGEFPSTLTGGFDSWLAENNQKVRAHTLNEAADRVHEEALYQAMLGNDVSRWLMVESIITSSLRGDNDETLYDSSSATHDWSTCRMLDRNTKRSALK